MADSWPSASKTEAYQRYFGIPSPDVKEFDSFKRWRESNCANALHEYCTRVFKQTCTVKTEAGGPDHMRHFQSRVRWPRAGVEGAGSGTTRKESERKAYEDLAVKLERLVGIAFDKDASTDPRPQSPPYGSRFGASSSKASPYSMPRPAPRKHFEDVFPGAKGHITEILELLDDSASEKVRCDRVIYLSRTLFNKTMDVNVVTPDHASSSFLAWATWPAGDVVGKGEGDTRKDAIIMAIEELRLALCEYIQEGLATGQTESTESDSEVSHENVDALAGDKTPSLRKATSPQSDAKPSDSGPSPEHIAAFRAQHKPRLVNATPIAGALMYSAEFVTSAGLPANVEPMRAIAYGDSLADVEAKALARLYVDVMAVLDALK